MYYRKKCDKCGNIITYSDRNKTVVCSECGDVTDNPHYEDINKTYEEINKTKEIESETNKSLKDHSWLKLANKAIEKNPILIVSSIIGMIGTILFIFGLIVELYFLITYTDELDGLTKIGVETVRRVAGYGYTIPLIASGIAAMLGSLPTYFGLLLNAKKELEQKE